MNGFEYCVCDHGNRLVDDVGCAVVTACGCRFDRWGKWKPELQLSWRAGDGRDFGDVFEFREWLLAPEQTAVFRRGKLNRAECRELWRATGRSDRTPRSLSVFVMNGIP